MILNRVKLNKDIIEIVKTRKKVYQSFLRAFRRLKKMKKKKPSVEFDVDNNVGAFVKLLESFNGKNDERNLNISSVRFFNYNEVSRYPFQMYENYLIILNLQFP